MIVVNKNRYRPVCLHCEGSLLPVYRQRSVTLRGVVSLLVLLLGVTIMATSLVVGAVVCILALVMGLSGDRKYTVLVCADCGQTGREL